MLSSSEIGPARSQRVSVGKRILLRIGDSLSMILFRPGGFAIERGTKRNVDILQTNIWQGSAVVYDSAMGKERIVRGSNLIFPQTIDIV